jgi:hypothetical protein
MVLGFWPRMSIAVHLEQVRERVARAAARAGRRESEITILAVSKTFPAERIREAYACGLRHFGENRVQEWEGKHPALTELGDAMWHLVGHLQSNKARKAVTLFHAIDSVDSLALAQKLDRAVAECSGGLQAGKVQKQKLNAEAARAQRPQRRLPILLEVRLAPEETKSGVEPASLPHVAEGVLALPHLELRGLMCIPPFAEDPQSARPYFRRLRAWREELTAHLKCPLPELSMGMSHDFDVAIEEGATQVRLGTALFGARM